MTETQQILESLKQQLRLKGFTYKDLSAHWKLSQSSVKRIMSGDDISIQRIESACQLMGLPISDFFQQVRFQQNLDFVYLSVKQEEALAQDSRLLHFFYLLQEGWSLSRILQVFSLTQSEANRFLLKLDELKVIELLPHNRVRKTITGHLRFRKEGPIGQQMAAFVKTQFLESKFKNEDEFLTFLNLTLTASDIAKLKMQLNQLSKDVSARSDLKQAHPNSQEYGLMVALRPWQSPFLQSLKKRKSKND